MKGLVYHAQKFVLCPGGLHNKVLQRIFKYRSDIVILTF